MTTDTDLMHRLRTHMRKPKSKRRRMRRFDLQEISVVDSPAQKGAIAVLMKREGESTMTTLHKLLAARAALDGEITKFLKAGKAGKPKVDLRGMQRTAPYLDEAEFEKEPTEEEELDENGEPFEKEPEEGEEPTSEGEDRGGVPYEGKPRRGDWPPGSNVPGPGTDEMTPERASQLLQRYADGGDGEEADEDETAKAEEDEEEYLAQMQDGVNKLAKRLQEKFPRASDADIEKLVDSAVHSSHAGFNPAMGREREYAKRAAPREQEQAPQLRKYRAGFSDEELLARMRERFPRTFDKNFERNFAKYRR